MTFGRHIKAFIPRSNLCTWRPTAIHSIHRLCEQSMRYMASVKSYEPATRNAGSDDEVEETRASSVTHMDTGEQCYFGHRPTTTRVRGKPVWNRNPACSWWPGRVPGLVTLCNKCFQIGRRHFLKGNKAPLPSTATNATPAVIASNVQEASEEPCGSADTLANSSSDHISANASMERAASKRRRIIGDSRAVSAEGSVQVHALPEYETALAAQPQEEVQHIHAQRDEVPTCPHGRTNSFWCSECNEAPDCADTWHCHKTSDAINASDNVVDTEAAVDTRIPGVGTSIATAEGTRGPSLLGAAPGECSSPAKAEGTSAKMSALQQHKRALAKSDLKE